MLKYSIESFLYRNWMETLSVYNVEYLKANHFDIDEVINLISVYCGAEDVERFREHIMILSDKYDTDYNMNTEMRSLSMELLKAQRHEGIILDSLRTFFWITEQDYARLLLDLMYQYQTDGEILKYLEVLNETFRMEPLKENMEELISLITLSGLDENIGGALLKEYARFNLENLSEIADTPSYMSKKKVNKDSIPVLTPPLSIRNPNKTNARFMVRQGLRTSAFEIEIPEGDPEQEIVKLLDTMSKSEKQELFDSYNSLKKSFLASIIYNIDAIQVFGPVSPEPEFIIDNLKDEYRKPKAERDINVIYGGPRMFYDTTRETDETDQVRITEWFTGNCEECSKKIDSYRYAVRRPLMRGGWVGCFCSFDCVKKSITFYFLSRKTEENNTSEDKEIDDSLDLELKTVEQMESIVNEAGIEDIITESDIYDFLESSDEE